MTQAQTKIPDRPQQYGYQWWVDRIRSPQLPPGRIWVAWSNRGNFFVAMPKQHAVAVSSGTHFNRADALEPLFWLRDRILPELAPEYRVRADQFVQRLNSNAISSCLCSSSVAVNQTAVEIYPASVCIDQWPTITCAIRAALAINPSSQCSSDTPARSCSPFA